MRRHFVDTLQLLRGERRLLGATLLLALALVVLTRALYHVFPIHHLPVPWYAMAAIGAPLHAVTLAFPGLVLLHALAQRASGNPVPFSASCKSVVTSLPSWFLLALILHVSRFVSLTVAHMWPLPFLEFEFFGLLFPGLRGSFIDQSISYLGTAIVLSLVAVPVLARLFLLIPAFTVLDRFHFGTALRLSARMATWRNVYALAPCLLLLFAAVHFNLWNWIRVMMGSTAHPMETPVAFALSSAFNTIVQQAALALLLTATIPMWLQVRERAEVEAEVYEADRGGLFTRRRVPWLGYIGIAFAVIVVHAAIMQFLMLELLSIAGSGRGLLFDSREAMDAGMGSILTVLSLPLIPFAYATEQLNPFYGGVAWAVTVIGILEAWRRFRRRRMSDAAQDVEE